MDFKIFLIKFFGSICLGSGIIAGVIVMLMLIIGRKKEMKP